ncbi:OapA family protein [Marinobacter salexigens]|uniref:Peptidoglycan DD-metalloendopeptidase family protein n=1 Tax=Marinobacter salexigens TaxID=1925763 RepID=A0ABS6A2V8_9GAMM|nr:peptidoglycan DD-metalloendopeptidase family protein [Marinobacter salexigens]MBU2872376.1 peptidoglycan DD-metalloendopeptidase family protein [Marinobacter salexigens]
MRHVLNMLPKTHITIAAAATVVVTTAILMSPSAEVEAKRMSYTLDLEQGQVSAIVSQKPQQKPIKTPEPAAVEQHSEITPQQVEAAAPSEPESRLTWQSFKIKSGDTLSSLFKKAGLNDGTMLSVIHGEGEADKLQRLYAGETIRFAIDSEGELAAIELQRSLLETLKIQKQESSYIGQSEQREPESKPAFASGTIDGSLYLGARDAGLNDRLTMELAGIFGWDIDFVYDVRKGDQFEVVYEELYIDGEKFSTGRILSARFVNRGQENIAILYTDSNGDSDYYTPEGKSMRKAFLRAPIDARISSSFNLQRRHPVLDVVRPHEGTDYAAPPGSPIKAAGNGRVQFSGWKGGYGRTIVLKHGDNITTLYAHMSRIGKGMKTGARVKQGDVIGYVGSSGMVTGPHLHYEFRVNGSPRNSRTVKLPDAQPIPATELARFKAHTEQQVAQFDAFRSNYKHLALVSED